MDSWTPNATTGRLVGNCDLLPANCADVCLRWESNNQLGLLEAKFNVRVSDENDESWKRCFRHNTSGQ